MIKEKQSEMKGNAKLSDEAISIKYVQLQTPVSLPGYFSTTFTLSEEKIRGIVMTVSPIGVMVMYNGAKIIIPLPNIISMVVNE